MARTAKQFAVSLYEQLHLVSHPGHWSTLVQQSKPFSSHSDREHIQAALAWLCRAQDACGGQGVSAGYFLRRGWMPAYPETTGYIIPTFLACRSLEPSLEDRACRMGNWEIDVQLPSGAVRGGIGLNAYPIVFNTGQVILGWTSLFRHTKDERYLSAAMRAADWLVDAQDPDGKWVRSTYLEAPRAYHSRVAWPLLEVFDLSGDERYRKSALAFIEWLLPQQLDNGFFPHMALVPDEVPITHTISYTLRGLLECARLLGPSGTQAKQAVQQSVNAIMERHPTIGQTGYLAGALDSEWQARASHMCLTGNAQLALVLLALSADSGDTMAGAARALIDRLKTHHPLDRRHPGIRGGLPSSHPIRGAYVPHAILNWGTKFLVDALWQASFLETRQAPSQRAC